MKPAELLRFAENLPEELDAWAYKDTIWNLKRKGYSTRKIAEFLNNHGIPGDHTTVSRIMNSHPVLDRGEALMKSEGIWYLSEPGRPLRSWSEALAPLLREATDLIILHNGWVEIQMSLSAAPAKIWLQQLHEELHGKFDPASPNHLKSHLGFEVRFSGPNVGILCLLANAKEVREQVASAMSRCSVKTPKSPAVSKVEKEADQQYRAEVLARYVPDPGQTEVDVIAGHEEWQREYRKKWIQNI